MKRTLLIIFVLCCILPACNKKGKDQKSKEKPPVTVDVILAQEQYFNSDIEVNGTVLSLEMIELHPEVSGRIVYLNVSDGALVKEGTVLVRINDAELQAQLEQQKNQLDLAVKTEQRYKILLESNSINQSDYDIALSQVNNYRAMVNVTLAQIDKTIIKAAFDGRLGLRMVSTGAYVTPQSVISTLQQTEKVKIDFTMPETYLDLINIGDTVTVHSKMSSTPGKAMVIAVEPQINTATRNIKVRALMIGNSLNPGAFVKVQLSKRSRGILVPSNAVIPDAMSNQLVIVKNNKAEFKNVETGIRTSDGVEITGGIVEGDSIIVSGVLFVRPGAKVKVKKSTTRG
ncbi:MAG: efflux RND transporter periplasmic adaptor subunit [Bacteroidales bacterium]